MSSTQTPNRLIHETSPYLLQHAHNPVDWYPWGEEAFQKAKAEDKAILLSCGYSACHWCHVMERESFENPEIAHLMNEYFVNIKVDREERPDIDQLYQEAVQALTGQGGWPLTVFLDYERRPFFGGTYFPPAPMYGRASFPQVLHAIYDKWRNQREDILKAGGELTNILQSNAAEHNQTEMPGREVPLRAAQQLYQNIDPQNGGFGKAPKFPNPSLLQLFLKLGITHHQSVLVDHVLFTLKQMAKGGIYDQIGGGFHRYSTDAHWLVPHFEKMLYDNAQLLEIYTIGYQLSGFEGFKEVVRETVAYIAREMAAPNGGFYATQDADSEGVEGKFFLWRLPEISEVLNPEAAQLIRDYYQLTERGNFEGANILNRLAEPLEIFNDVEHHPQLQHRLKEAKEKLLQAREKRVKPFRDEKIITSWNGLMIGALAYVYQVFGREADYQLARGAAEFILGSLRLPDGSLARIYKDGQAKVEAMLDDYAFLAQGLITLYEADFNQMWLRRSLELMERAMQKYSDGEGRYYIIGDTHNLVARPLSGYDQAIPSGVAIHCQNLLRLAAFTGRKDLYQEAVRILTAYSREMEKESWGFASLIGSLDLYYQGFQEFTFISEGNAVPEILGKLREKSYIPYRILAWHNSLTPDGTAHPAGALFENRGVIQGKPTCYSCSSNKCLEPVTDWEHLKTSINDFQNNLRNSGG